MTSKKTWKLLGASVPVPVLIAILLLTVSPAQGLVISAPTPNVASNTSTIAVTLTFEDGDIIPIDELQLVFKCSATGSATDRFEVDGTAIAQTRTTGSAAVTGSPAALNLLGPQGGYQTGYGYGYGGHGAPTGDRSFSGYGYGYGYGYAGPGGNTLTYVFTLLRSAFAINESCTAVLVVDTPVSGDFDSPRSVSFRPRVAGGGGGVGSSPPGTTVTTPAASTPGPLVDTDGDGVPDAVETFLGTDPNDADSKPSHDMTSRVTVQRVGNSFVLTWDWPDGFKPLGVQVWRSNSPFVLRATLDGNYTAFEDVGAPENSVYKVTWFTDYTEAGGYFADAAHAASIFGWQAAGEGDGSSGSGRGGSDDDGVAAVFGLPVATWLVILVTLVVVGGVVALVMRRGPKDPE